MKFTNEEQGCSFEIPDRPTVRQQLAFRWALDLGNIADGAGRFWSAAIPLITSWECEKFPDYKVSLDEVTQPSIGVIVSWVATEVVLYMNALDDIPPNS